MDRGAESDLFLLADEKFDFDVSLSPASSDEDEDEVFVGPVSHKQRFASVTVGSWSPLSGDQLEEVCQEARRLADQLQGLSRPRGEDATASDATDATATVSPDGFVRSSKAELALRQAAGAPSPIKRQTFCVQDSPMKLLPPADQRRLLRGPVANAASTRPVANATSARPAAKVASTTLHAGAASPGHLAGAGRSSSSPVAAVKPLARTGLRGRAALSGAVVLPSKPAAASCSAGRSAAEKPRLQPPSRTLGSWRRSPSLSAAGSCEDLLSDSASVASDVSDSSLNGKRTLAPPTKRALLNPSGVKAPPLQRRRVTERKNSSSSSSSLSSFNSSFSLSPAPGKLSSTGPAPISRPRPYAAPPEPAAAVRRCSLSTRARKLSEAERLKAASSTPLKRAEATPLQLTPAKRAASIPAAASARLQKNRPEATVAPTVGGGGGRHGDTADASRPKRLTSVDSLPQTPSAGGCRSRRPSALPTPVRRRMSSIPVATPTRPPPPTFDPASAGRSEKSCSPTPADTQEAELVDVHPFCLEEEEPPAALPPASPPPQTADQSGSTDQGGSEPSKNLIELEPTEEESNTQEVLLLDLPAPAPRPQEKLLIDLTNTPDLMRTGGNKTCSASQLIDLSSPLIKWSPDEKRENVAPLINLSF
ncbi:G2 and S phase-expressed protein 1 [Pseudoliparis swirei]|uniref:G2 and S phase-expressed protein 1 n=1 Tax=Pseudoliparis swirei TaxID=2059687 RepID=UPI0024BE5DB8|nr:G2 and S phase-expressed protein 1 [Pseudoliparis swirei]